MGHQRKAAGRHPDDFINVILSVKNITPADNINLARFDDPAFQAGLNAAAH